MNLQLFGHKTQQRDDQKNDGESTEIKKKQRITKERIVSMNIFRGNRADKGIRGPSPAAIEWRRSQIEYGKNCIGYKNLINLYPDYELNKKKGKGWKFDFAMIEMPKLEEKVGKKRWVGRYKKWRQFLHEFDNLESVIAKMRK